MHLGPATTTLPPHIDRNCAFTRMSDNESTSWIDENRNRHESDDQWIRRRDFMRKYVDNFEKNRLICLSKVYVNTKYLGCDYDSELVKQVAELASGCGGDVPARTNAEQRKLIKASRGRAEAEKSKRKRPADASTSAPPAKMAHMSVDGDIKMYVQFFSSLRVQLMQTDKNADSMQMLNQACGKQRRNWILEKDADGAYVLSVDQPTLCNIGVHHLLQTARVDIKPSERPGALTYDLLKGGVDPDHCFVETIRTCLGKVGAFLASSMTSKKDSLARLTEAMDRQNFDLLIDEQHTGGWNQELTFSIASGAIILAERTIGKKECTRINEIKLEIAGVLCEHLSENQKEAQLDPVEGRPVYKLQL
ncbi:hypothetical protein L596_030394 [Steinernema carpocapsae]|uniref:XRN2-binding (XTBD) domain-containing protein n=1 Tax=Steinernema carpocapsae TaxID=34508 RepID=A0A4U5LP90_STECR|nr:hypothetical protein L596_030394 [Steinernema carpocapsae]